MTSTTYSTLHNPFRNLSIMVGGTGEKVTLKITARHTDISHINAANVDAFEHKLAILKQHCKTVGRDYTKIRKATSMNMPDLKETKALEKLVNDIEEYKKRGVGLITLRLPVSITSKHSQRRYCHGSKLIYKSLK
ncbi:MAG: hypothetical protein QG670_371 [Thermoproteota archaeon]|nr:hypothetical protein [Thermoproteota archaeon]